MEGGKCAFCCLPVSGWICLWTRRSCLAQQGSSDNALTKSDLIAAVFFCVPSYLSFSSFFLSHSPLFSLFPFSPLRRFLFDCNILFFVIRLLNVKQLLTYFPYSFIQSPHRPMFTLLSTLGNAILHHVSVSDENYLDRDDRYPQRMHCHLSITPRSLKTNSRL